MWPIVDGGEWISTLVYTTNSKVRVEEIYLEGGDTIGRYVL